MGDDPRAGPPPRGGGASWLEGTGVGVARAEGLPTSRAHRALTRAGSRARAHSLLRLQVPVDDAQAMEVVQSQGQLGQVELDVLLREHHLASERTDCWGLVLRNSARETGTQPQSPAQVGPHNLAPTPRDALLLQRKRRLYSPTGGQGGRRGTSCKDDVPSPVGGAWSFLSFGPAGRPALGAAPGLRIHTSASGVCVQDVTQQKPGQGLSKTRQSSGLLRLAGHPPRGLWEPASW